MDKKKKILDFISKEKLAVIATVDIENNRPESAVLEFGQSDTLEIIFDTFISSRKYKNLQANKNVSFVIGWEENITVQYEGVAKELVGEEKSRYQQLYWSKNPEAERWAERDGIAYFRV